MKIRKKNCVVLIINFIIKYLNGLFIKKRLQYVILIISANLKPWSKKKLDEYVYIFFLNYLYLPNLPNKKNMTMLPTLVYKMYPHFVLSLECFCGGKQISPSLCV